MQPVLGPVILHHVSSGRRSQSNSNKMILFIDPWNTGSEGQVLVRGCSERLWEFTVATIMHGFRVKCEHLKNCSFAGCYVHSTLNSDSCVPLTFALGVM